MNEKTKHVFSLKPSLRLARTTVILLFLAVHCLSICAQTNLKVHGTVTSATDGLPLIGVNVVQQHNDFPLS